MFTYNERDGDSWEKVCECVEEANVSGYEISNYSIKVIGAVGVPVFGNIALPRLSSIVTKYNSKAATNLKLNSDPLQFII